MVFGASHRLVCFKQRADIRCLLQVTHLGFGAIVSARHPQPHFARPAPLTRQRKTLAE